jgi:hypothetical protein
VGRKANDMLGLVLGKWTVLGKAESKPDGSLRWLCRCECGNERPVAANALRRGSSKQCKECSSASLSLPINPKAVRVYKTTTAQREKYKTTGTKFRLWRLYRLSPEDYNKILLHQKGACAVCGKAPGRIRLAVDHDHKTGRIRGLLCWPCNHALGVLRDSQELVLQLGDYLLHPTAPSALQKETYGLIGKAQYKKKMIYGSPTGPIKPSKKEKK